MLEIISEDGSPTRMIWSFTVIVVVIFIGGKCVDLGNVEVVVWGSNRCEVRIKISGRRRWVRVGVGGGGGTLSAFHWGGRGGGESKGDLRIGNGKLCSPAFLLPTPSGRQFHPSTHFIQTWRWRQLADVVDTSHLSNGLSKLLGI